MPNKPKILVQGATGQVGKNGIPHRVDNDKVEVLAAARSPEKAKELGVPVVYLDLDKPDSIASALEGIDRAFIATGYTIDMMRQSKDFLNIAKKAGVKHIVHRGACGDDDTRVAHYVWHQFIERYIEWCGFSFTHLRPEIFMQNLLGYGGENYVKNGVIRHYIGKARWSWVDIEDVAAVAAACLLDPEKHNGQTYRLGYQAATYDQIAAILTEVIGQPFSYEAPPPEDFYPHSLAACAEPAYMKCVFSLFSKLTNRTAVKPDHVFDDLQVIIGRNPRTSADFAKKHGHKLRYQL